MAQQPNSNQSLNIDGTASVEGQVGQAGRDLIQTMTAHRVTSASKLF